MQDSERELFHCGGEEGLVLDDDLSVLFKRGYLVARLPLDLFLLGEGELVERLPEGSRFGVDRPIHFKIIKGVGERKSAYLELLKAGGLENRLELSRRTEIGHFREGWAFFRGDALHDELPDQMDRLSPVEFTPDGDRHLSPRLQNPPHLF